MRGQKTEQAMKQPRVKAPAVGATGEFLSTDEYGEWRSIPGFSSDVLIVSSKGFVCRQRDSKRNTNDFGEPCLLPQSIEGYRHLSVDGNRYSLSQLILWAFRGGPGKNETADHIAKHGGDFVAERGDDRAENLRWATKSEQSINRTMIQPQRRSAPVLARHESWPPGSKPRRFSSCLVAASELGLNQGNISNVLGGAREVHTTGGWSFAWAEPDEPQCNLVTEADGEERWSVVGDRGRCKVSSHGRYQTMRGRSATQWGSRRTPLATRGTVYATLRVDGKLHRVHRLVWSAFGNRALVGDETVDHIDRNTTNNCASNLRPATRSQQAQNQNRGKRVRE